MSKLDNNSKMIVSKYLIGKDFIDFTKAFKIQDYYFTTFNYIIINNNILNITIKRIIRNLQSFTNLNEIVLNFVSLDWLYLFDIINYYNRFKRIIKNKQIKFRFVNENYKAYNKIYVRYQNIDYYMEFFKNIFEPNVKQKVYLLFDNDVINDVYKYTNYNILIDLFDINKYEILNNFEKFKKYNIYYTVLPNYKYKFKINKINDINRYFIIDNNLIKYVKPNYIYKVKYLDDFNLYYQLFKIKHMNLNYLNNYITNANDIINTIYDKDIRLYKIEFCSIIVNMYKYGVINIYEDIIDDMVVYNKFELIIRIKDISPFKYFIDEKSTIKHSFLMFDINHYIRY